MGYHLVPAVSTSAKGSLYISVNSMFLLVFTSLTKTNQSFIFFFQYWKTICEFLHNDMCYYLELITIGFHTPVFTVSFT